MKLFIKQIYLCLIFLFGFSCVFVHADDEDERIFQYSTEPLFVSLGSVCEPAHMLRFCELRKVAFPFDWIVSMDGEALIELLENDFKDFLTDEYFVPYGPAGHLLHTHYHLEFLHDGNFNQQYDATLVALKNKYQRRIQRFKNLVAYPGKVFFIRNAYWYSTTDPNRFYKFEDNLEISEEYSLRLFHALKNFFPKLDFDLLIINCCDGESFQEQKEVSDHVRMFRVNPHMEQSKKIESYRAFFQKLYDRE